MRTEIVLAGVGGQGVLSMAAIIAAATRHEGLHVKQGEVHGMSQRGGSVRAFLRIADWPIHSDLVALGTADMILSLEPIESLRYLAYLRPGGALVTSIDPVENVPDYPDRESVLAMLHRAGLGPATERIFASREDPTARHDATPRCLIVEAAALAKKAGSPLATNTVMVGAASHFLPLRCESIQTCLREGFAAKGQKIVDVNLEAFRLGRESVKCPAAT